MKKSIFISTMVLLIYTSGSLFSSPNLIMNHELQQGISLSVLAPNGGERIKAGSSYTVTWSSAFTSSVTINISFDNGNVWYNIATTSGLSGSFIWTVPAITSESCKLKITDNNNPSNVDESDGVFVIYQPTVTVISPNGGEILPAGNITEILWSSDELEKVNLEYSINNGLTYTAVATEITASDGRFSWSVPLIDSEVCRIRVSDNANSGISDVSDQSFSISNRTDWSSHVSGVETSLKSVYFIDYYTGWSCGDGGVILKTTDGGTTWEEKNSDTGSDLWSIYFVSENVGWTAGRNGTILVSLNGGHSWVRQTSNFEGGLFDIYFQSPSTGWACGDAGMVLKTTDWGTTWTTQYTGSQSWLTSINFVDPNTGWVVGSDGAILKTIDGGVNWTQQTSNVTKEFWACDFVNSQNGWVVGGGSNILKTTNGGTNWVPQSTGRQSVILGIAMTGENEAWTCGGFSDGEIFATTDGGARWNQQRSTTDKRLWDVHFKDNYLGWAVGDAGTIIKYEVFSPVITILNPSGGEMWSVGSTQVINWLSRDIENVNIEYSINGGATYEPVASNLSASYFSYDWDIPNTPSDNCKIKISDTENNYSDVTEVNFSIRSSANPFIKVLTPNLSENYNAGSYLNITWMSENIAAVNIDYTINNGADWIEVVSSLSSTGLYKWNIPNTPSLQCKVRVSDASISGAFDVSDEPFTIIEAVASSNSDVESGLPSEFCLYPNYPNPFNPQTRILFDIPEEGYISVSVYDILGNKIADLVSEQKPAGRFEVIFDGSNLNSGIYLCRMNGENFSQTRKMLLVK